MNVNDGISVSMCLFSETCSCDVVGDNLVHECMETYASGQYDAFVAQSMKRVVFGADSLPVDEAMRSEQEAFAKCWGSGANLAVLTGTQR